MGFMASEFHPPDAHLGASGKAHETCSGWGGQPPPRAAGLLRLTEIPLWCAPAGRSEPGRTRGHFLVLTPPSTHPRPPPPPRPSSPEKSNPAPGQAASAAGAPGLLPRWPPAPPARPEARPQGVGSLRPNR